MPGLILRSILAASALIGAENAVSAAPLEDTDDYVKLLLTSCIVDDLTPLAAKAAAIGVKRTDGFEQTVQSGGLTVLEHTNGITFTFNAVEGQDISCSAIIPAGVLSDEEHVKLFDRTKSLFGSMYGAPFDVTEVQGGEVWVNMGTANNQLQVQIVRVDGATLVDANSTALAQ